MMDITLPPIKKYAVVNKEDTILLITSGLQIASWYQLIFNKQNLSSEYRIETVSKDKIFSRERI
tara:strand:- start:191 stop:382 length:192 start_codon:yes stop_codon:yes gene_type:complete